MVRKKGYLNLDLYYNKVGNEKNLILETEDEFYRCWLTINQEKYYFKSTSDGLNEIISYEFAKLMNISCVPYDLAVFRDNYGVISKSYHKDGCIYIPGYEILKKYYEEKLDVLLDMGFDLENAKRNKYGGVKCSYRVQMNNLETIWEALSYYFPERDISGCMKKLVEQFIFSILSGQSDKAAHNWEIEVSKDNIELVDMFDNEESFKLFSSYSEMAVFMHNGKSTFKEVLKDFLRVSSREYIDLFLEKYNLFTEENMNKVISIIEDKYNMEISSSKKNRLLEYVRNTSISIDDVLEQLNIKNNIGRK